MKKLIFLLFLIIHSLFGQKERWKGYFSFNNITDVVVSENQITTSTSMVLFSKNLQTNVLSQTTTVDGIKTDLISAIFITSNGFKLIGNQNGVLNIVKPNGDVVNKVDIFIDVPVPQTQKRINDFYEYNGKIYISTDYGISVLNTSNFEIAANYYIGNSGEYIKVNQVSIFNNEIFAATSQGLKKANINNQFLFDFNQWQVAFTGNWLSIINFSNQLIGMSTDGNTYRIGSTLQQIFNHGSLGKKLRSDGEFLTITSTYQIAIFNSGLVLNNIYYNIPNLSTQFTCAITKNQKLYIGTSSEGLYETTISTSNIFTKVSPQGPAEERAFRVKKIDLDLWVTHGGYNVTADNDPNLTLKDISILETNGWIKIPKENLFNAVALAEITQNPRNKKEVFVGSHHSGLLKITGKSNIVLYNQTNTGSNGLENQQFVTPTYISVRVNGLKFDKAGNLWMTNSLINSPLKTLRTDNTWSSYNLSNIIVNIIPSGYGSMEVDKNDTKWISTSTSGILAYNEKLNKSILIREENGMPTDNVVHVTIDKKNQLWIGTKQGLRVLNNVDNFLSSNSLTVRNIVINDNGVGQELFNEQLILDIYVDGANNKWVSTANAGVFLVSSNGQQTLQRFTKENSPLPSNTVNDIEIDENTGEVFFATDNGIVSFKNSATSGEDDLSNVYAYPNPVRPNFSGTVKLTGLMDKCNVKITDIEGNLVHEATSQGGTIEWDTTAFGRYKVASGVYMVFVVSETGEETTVEKIMIVR